jgi:UDP-glucuronate decarboxylase
MRTVLITGGAGFIGTHMAQRLLAEGNSKVVLLDNFRRDSLRFVPELKEHPQVTAITGDVQDAAAIASLVAEHKPDIVMHLAAIAGVSSYYSEPLRTLQTNILGTVNMLEAVAAAKSSLFIHFSTSEVYGSNALWVEENQPTGIGPVSDLRWVYATSKLAGENFALRYAEQKGFNSVVIRPFNIYGPRQIGEGAISNFCRAVSCGEPMRIYGDGSAIRAWCYIDDLVDAMLTIMANPPKGDRVFNIGNPVEVETTLGLARRIMSIDDKGKASVEHHEGVHSEVRVRIPCIDRAAKTLGYQPKIGLDEGLKRTLAWFRNNEKIMSAAESGSGKAR